MRFYVVFLHSYAGMVPNIRPRLLPSISVPIHYALIVYNWTLYRVQDHRRTLLFGKIRKNLKREKLLKIMCFQPQLLEFFAWDEPLRRYTHYVINSKMLRRCCHVDITVGECLSRVEGSGSEGDTGTIGNTKWTKPGKPQRLGNCNVDMATSPFLFTTGDVKWVAPNGSSQIRDPNTWDWKHTAFNNYTLFIFFRILPNNRVLLRPRTHGTYCIVQWFPKCGIIKGGARVV
jgi:hypothetical protein